MQALKPEFIDQCPIENGFRLRGIAMTRIEVFVDAAFAFAVTMLVISIDQIPRSMDELLAISKYIPAFILSVAQLIFIWQNHSNWSRKFGLEDGKTVFLSVSLLVVVLIFIYPMKMMYQGLFAWLTNDYLPSQFRLESYHELRYLFYYFAIGFMALILIFIALYKHALKFKIQLVLSVNEVYKIETAIWTRRSMAAVCVFALVLPALLPEHAVPYAGFAYSLMWPLSAFIRNNRERKWLESSLSKVNG